MHAPDSIATTRPSDVRSLARRTSLGVPQLQTRTTWMVSRSIPLGPAVPLDRLRRGRYLHISPPRAYLSLTRTFVIDGDLQQALCALQRHSPAARRGSGYVPSSISHGGQPKARQTVRENIYLCTTTPANACVSPQRKVKERTKQECSPPLSSLVISRLRSVSRKMPPSQRIHPCTHWYYF